MSRIICGIQARMGSGRLPNKVMMPIRHLPILAHCIELAQWLFDRDVFLLTTLTSEDDIIERWADEYHIRCVRGSTEDVAQRYKMLINREKPSYVFRMCADSIRWDCKLNRALLKLVRDDPGHEYYSYRVGGTSTAQTKLGMCCEIFRADAPIEGQHVCETLYKPEQRDCSWIDLPEKLHGVVHSIDTIKDYKREASQ